MKKHWLNKSIIPLVLVVSVGFSVTAQAEAVTPDGKQERQTPIVLQPVNFGSVNIGAPIRDVANLFPYPDAELTLINHRGLSPNMPENTLVAFRNSVAMGVDVIEIDLRPTKDGEIVILHDDTVDRSTNGTGAVKDLTLEEVKQLDAGSYAGEEFSGEQIPTYAEALETVKGTGVRLLLDIKDASQVQQIVEVTVQYDMIDQVIVGPRSVSALQEFKALNPNLTTLGFIETMADADAFIDAGVDYIRQWPDWILASRDDAECQADYAERVAAYERGERSHPGSASCIVEEVDSRGVPVWSTTNDMGYEGMDELLQLGVTGILSDVPGVLDQLLEDIEEKREAVLNTISFINNDLDVMEQEGSSIIKVTRDYPTDHTITVDYATSDYDAKRGSDYEAVSGKLVFGPGETVKTIHVPIKEDDLIENDEYFVITIGNPVGGKVFIPQSEIHVKIVDNDRAAVSFKNSVYNAIEEQKKAQLSVIRTGSLGEVSFRLEFESGTAQNGKDFSQSSRVLTFKSGETEKLIDIPLVDDGLREYKESFKVRLSDPTPTENVTIDIPAAEVFIFDADHLPRS